jgi:hypothetical protein
MPTLEEGAVAATLSADLAGPLHNIADQLDQALAADGDEKAVMHAAGAAGGAGSVTRRGASASEPGGGFAAGGEGVAATGAGVFAWLADGGAGACAAAAAAPGASDGGAGDSACAAEPRVRQVCVHLRRTGTCAAIPCLGTPPSLALEQWKNGMAW